MKVRFLPQDVEFEIAPNQSVMQLAHEKGLYVKSVCKGIPNCAECRVRIIEGEHNVLPPSSAELALIGTAYFVDRRRLSCQLRCFGDVTVDLREQEEKRQSAGKRPRGSGPRDQAESYAVRGNMIETDDHASEALAGSLEADTGEDEDKIVLHPGTGDEANKDALAGVRRGEGSGRKRRRRRRRRN